MSGDASSDQQTADISLDPDDKHAIKFLDWGFNVDRLYDVAYKFYKRNESKAFHPSFDVRNQMNALTLQAKYGDFDNGKAPDIGVLDFVGKRRQYEWALLKGMSRIEAMSKFICNLDELCPLFKAHVEAVKVSSGVARHTIDNNLSDDTNSIQGSCESAEQLKAIYSSLARQTQNQFKSYAEKQYPDDILHQKQFVRSLQEQYFQQYISQMHPELKQFISNEEFPAKHGEIDASAVDQSESRLLNNCVDEFSLPIPREVKTNLPHSASISDKSSADQNNLINIESKSIAIKPDDGRADENHLSKIQSVVETDITSEELNTSDHSITDQHHIYELTNTASQNNISNLSSVPLPFEKQNEVQSHHMTEPSVEHVRLYQHDELLPIGPFESFPEPKPIYNDEVTSRRPIVDLDPNIKHNESHKRIPSDVETQYEKIESQLSDSRFITSQPVIKNTKIESFGTSTELESAGESKIYIDEPQIPLNHSLSDQAPSHSEMNDHYDSPQVPAQFDNIDTNQKALVGQMQSSSTSQKCHPEPWGHVSPESEVEYCLTPEHEANDVAVLSNSNPCQCEPASTWSKKGVSEFKDSLSADKDGGFCEIKEGTVMVIQVPTYPDGRFIYWEFATDDFDIGFGLEFVHETNLVEPLSISIYEDSDDDDEFEPDEGVECHLRDGLSRTSFNSHLTRDIDPEAGKVFSSGQTSDCKVRNLEPKQLVSLAKAERLANTITILPTYRRDSHEEIFVGKHRYPGTGYYLLRFDNTYSVLRSKVLYFRICCFV